MKRKRRRKQCKFLFICHFPLRQLARSCVRLGSPRQIMGLIAYISPRISLFFWLLRKEKKKLEYLPWKALLRVQSVRVVATCPIQATFCVHRPGCREIGQGEWEKNALHLNLHVPIFPSSRYTERKKERRLLSRLIAFIALVQYALKGWMCGGHQTWTALQRLDNQLNASSLRSSALRFVAALSSPFLAQGFFFVSQCRRRCLVSG